MFRRQNDSVKWQYFLVGALLGAGGLYLYLEQKRKEDEANNPPNGTGTGTNTPTSGDGGTLNPNPNPQLLPPCNCNSGNKCGGCNGGGGGVTIVTAGVGRISGTRYF